MTQAEMTGQLIRQLRTDRGWNTEDMSREILRKYGVKFQTSPRTIERAEKGHRPSVRKAFAIAAVLDTVPSRLWDEEGAFLAAA